MHAQACSPDNLTVGQYGCVALIASVWWRTKAQQTGLWRGMAELSSIYHSFIIGLSSLRIFFIVFLLALLRLRTRRCGSVVAASHLGCPSSMALAVWRSGRLFLAYVSGCTARTNMHTCTRTRKKESRCSIDTLVSWRRNVKLAGLHLRTLCLSSIYHSFIIHLSYRWVWFSQIGVAAFAHWSSCLARGRATAWLSSLSGRPLIWGG